MTLLDVVLSLAILVAACVLRPHHARCPDREWLPEGVRRDGSYVCRPQPIGGDHFTGRAWVDDSIVPPMPPTFAGVIYCTGGAIPIDVDGVRVGCQARH